jgi:hypothetical protein
MPCLGVAACLPVAALASFKVPSDIAVSILLRLTPALTAPPVLLPASFGTTDDVDLRLRTLRGVADAVTEPTDLRLPGTTNECCIIFLCFLLGSHIAVLTIGHCTGCTCSACSSSYTLPTSYCSTVCTHM